MPELNPMLLRRMLALRQFPMFASAELAELAMIAENVVEATYRAGAVVAPAGTRVAGIQLVLDGRIEAGRAWGPHDLFGALEVFARREPAVAAIAATETHTLQLSAADLADVLEDNYGVLVAVVRDLAGQLARAGRPLTRPVAIPPASAPLGLVERLIVLRQQAPFVGARLQGLAMLAHASEELSWEPGATVVRAGEPASGALLVIEGLVHAHDGAGRRGELGPGHATGALETLAGLAHPATLEAITPVRVLRSGGTAILDVLEDHPDVGMQMISTFAKALLDDPRGGRGRGEASEQATGDRAN
ncbi:MAG TPA: cyclic nucleotide-binding domain-containing protein [Kofleriaceae bacterium]|nr:cyclic nucleotide-binding domain-containing protein [Kofleriaceae bacterium]